MDGREIRSKLKKWENQFYAVQGRKPNKNDIGEAPKEIQQLYRAYKLKRSSHSSAAIPNESVSLPVVVQGSEVNPWDLPVQQLAVVAKLSERKSFAQSSREKLLSNIRQCRKATTDGSPSKPKLPPASPRQKECLTMTVNQEEEGENKAPAAPTSMFSARRLLPKERAALQLPAGRPVRNRCSLLGKTLNSELVNLDSVQQEPEPPVPSTYTPAARKHVEELQGDLPSADDVIPKVENQRVTHVVSQEQEPDQLKSSGETETNNSTVAPASIKSYPLVESPSVKVSDELSPSPSPAAKRRKTTTPAATPSSRKPSSSAVDANYVRLNLKVKRFSRKGGARQKFLRIKQRREKWRKKMSNSAKTTTGCFRCGQEGHWANKCPGRLMDGARAVSNSAAGSSDFPPEIPVLVERKDYRLLDIDHLSAQTVRIAMDDGGNPEERFVEPIFTEMPTEGRSNRHQVVDMLKRLGFSSFRPGQEKAIRRVLCGKSTILVIPTGGGKSLCYQLPALMYQESRKTCALIISPLIALMQDQLARMPNGLRGACLNSTLTRPQRETILEEARRGEFAFLLVSPEALVNYSFLTPDKLPPISFACIDEVHCLADWSHHFRPSYLRVCNLLRERYGVRCFLGLSATCTRSAMERIAEHLRIEDPAEGCISAAPLPANLLISASRDPQRDEALLRLLQRKPFAQLSSILIYCATRDQTVRLAGLIRTALKDLPPVQVGRRKLTWTADAYHAGMTVEERARLQRRFMQGRLRVMTATVAFGMGLDKSDLRAVIHYTIPKSFENYVQEIGRAGRDEQLSFCHVFVPEGGGEDRREFNELRRHIYANYVEFSALKRLLRQVFYRCECSDERCAGHLRCLPVTKTVQQMDIREETLETLLCCLELHPSHCLRLLPSAHQRCSLRCYRGPKQLADLSQRNMAVSAGLSLADRDSGSFEPANQRSLELDLVDLCDRFGWDLSAVRKDLSALEWTSSTELGAHKTGTIVEFTDWSWCLWTKGDLDDEAMDNLLDFLTGRLRQLERDTVDNMEALRHLLLDTAVPSVDDLDLENAVEDDAGLLAKSRLAHQTIADFFSRGCGGSESLPSPQQPLDYSASEKASIRGHIRSFVRTYTADHHDQLTGKVVACVLHGIGTPLFPAEVWGRVHRFWRSALTIDWPTLYKWANEELIDMT